MERPDRKAILLDSNLLVLLVVGTTSKTLIGKHKKTRIFTVADYERLVALLGERPVLILPHIAAEASNLLGFHEEPERSRLLKVLRNVLAAIDEEYVASRRAASEPEHVYLGLTDAAILVKAADAEIVTTDAKLHLAALRRGNASLNFNHPR